jgi:hypothetical protein
MTLGTCHLYVQRLLRALTDGPESYLFRIDPDARVWRRFQFLPAFTSVFGTIENATEGNLVKIRPP